MSRMHGAGLALFLSTVPAQAVNAQSQTAEGAQRFLSLVAEQAPLLVSAEVTTTMSRHWFDGELLESNTFPMRHVQQAGAYEFDPARACSTTITSKPLDPAAMAQSVEGVGRYSYTLASDPVVFVANIDWGRVTIKRGAYLVSHESFKDEGISAWSGDTVISYKTRDPELIDRIEYAMKFLKMSCDKTADTGF